MTITTLPIPTFISQASQRKPKKPAMILAQFGDGYSQRVPDGLNPIIDMWTITWGLVDPVSRNLFWETFETVGTWTKMLWTPNTDPSFVPVTSLTRTGVLATASTTPLAHNFNSTDIVTIAGATSAAYNGSFVITVMSATSFYYTVAGSPTTPDSSTSISVLEAQYWVFADSPQETVMSGVAYDIVAPIMRVFDLG